MKELLTFVENNPGCTMRHIHEFVFTGLHEVRRHEVRKSLVSGEIVPKHIGATTHYYIASHGEQFSAEQLAKLADITQATCELKMEDHPVHKKGFTMETAYQLGTMTICFGLGLLCGYIMGCAT